MVLKIPGCPKNIKDCPRQMCPLFPCFAYEEHLDRMDKAKSSRDRGWE
jgi:hypothetical protein